MLESAKFVKFHGATAFRGGIFKLRTSAKSFQGLREKSLPIIEKVKSHTQLLMVSEITDPRQIEFLEPLVDVYQVGARNMFNYDLLKELGQTLKPILLKRSFSAKIEEWLKATDYIIKGGNENIILCERGIRTFETKTRNTLDLNAVAFLKQESSFPVFVDPSHGTGLSQLVPALSQSAVCAGADGLLIEVHPNPDESLCDSQQALSFSDFENLMIKLKKLTQLYGKKL
ncbi:MAG: 3-deoxy-7-phosphoheptulonate synthase [Bdellovibrionaceae bacterium]|nr:3-deoxy-7-phosphoheptulonate synthase [Pseudobdellovibrionaceae bacterium]